MTRKWRKNDTPEEKVAILKRHLINGELVSDLCDELHLQPVVFFRWQKEFFEKGAKVFQREKGTQTADRKITRLEQRLTHKDEVISELVSAYVKLKKTLGEP